MYNKSEVEKKAIDFFKDDMAANVWLDKYALKKNKNEFLELSPDDTIIRISKEISRIEQKYPNPVSYEVIYNLFHNFNKFVLGGSALFSIGNNTTYSTIGNCFVIDSPYDSYGGIFHADQELAQLMKRRGGVGIDISSLRPRNSYVKNAASSSTGAISFAERFSNTTREVAQEGRRGALMISLDITHPDIEEFITSKDDLTKITGANISIKITDAFMQAVEKDDIFILNFDNKIELEISALRLWDKIIHQAWKTAEPGLLFWDNIIRESPADCYEEFKTISTNPCSELPLCAYDSCRLSAINLYAYVKNPFTNHASFDEKQLEIDVEIYQRIMDDIVDLEHERITDIINKINSDVEPENIKNTEIEVWKKIDDKLLKGRRTGLGQMGLADAGAALGLKYGSDDFIDFTIAINTIISTSSYVSSINMAKERGAFPVWDYNKEKNNPYLSRLFNEIWDYGDSDTWEDYKQYGRRNIANLTIAPTGSISMLAGVSSGIEPVFALSYNRKRKVTVDNPNKKFQDKQGDWWEEYKIFHPKLKDWLKAKGVGKPLERFKEPFLSENLLTDSPYYKACAHEIDPNTKLKLQSVIQPWIDHSISVTYNLPSTVTEKEVSNLYFKAWKLGLKGLTVYREGSREGVLTIKTENKFNKYDAPKRPKDLLCDIHNIMAKGRPWKVFIGLMDEEPYEVFAVNGKIDRIPIDKGILRKIKQGRYDLISLSGEVIVEDITHNMTQDEEAFTRTISWALRHGAKLEFGIEQLSKSQGDITSFSKAIARTLKKYIKDGMVSTNINCPNCGSILSSDGGCWVCKQCGYSKCE